MKYLCKFNIFFCKNTSLLTGGSSTHKTSVDAWTVPGRASDDLLRDIWKFTALVRHRTMPGRAPYGARTGTVGIVRYKLKNKSSGARPMCANAGRAPSGHRTVPGQCHFILIDPTERRTGAVEF